MAGSQISTGGSYVSGTGTAVEVGNASWGRCTGLREVLRQTGVVVVVIVRCAGFNV